MTDATDEVSRLQDVCASRKPRHGQTGDPVAPLQAAQSRHFGDFTSCVRFRKTCLYLHVCFFPACFLLSAALLVRNDEYDSGGLAGAHEAPRGREAKEPPSEECRDECRGVTTCKSAGASLPGCRCSISMLVRVLQMKRARAAVAKRATQYQDKSGAGYGLPQPPRRYVRGVTPQ
jgi:hypothetical protein